MSFLGDLFGGGAEKQAADANRALYGSYLSQGNKTLDSALGKSETQLNDARSAFTPLSDLAGKYGGATDLYLDALGVNGPQGNTRATSAFQATPGYDFTLSQGLDAINRRRAAGGMLDSGNADIDALKFGTGLADQTFGSYLDRLGGFVSPELSATAGAASGTAGVDTALSNLYQNDATNRIGLSGNYTSGMAGANNLQAAGAAQGSRNLLGLGLGIAGMGTGGGATVGGNIIKGIFG
jgi:hypothetical protein